MVGLCSAIAVLVINDLTFKQVRLERIGRIKLLKNNQSVSSVQERPILVRNLLKLPPFSSVGRECR